MAAIIALVGCERALLHHLAESALSTCGNGRVEPGEQCDDAGLNDDTLPDHCRTSCVLPFCGDGVRDSGEECDDGNDAPGDRCNPGCVEWWWTDVDNGPVSGGDWANGVAVGESGEVYAVGRMQMSAWEGDIWLRKYAADGTRLWSRMHEGEGGDDDYALDVALTPDGIVVAGTSKTATDRVAWFREYDTEGDELWTLEIPIGPILYPFWVVGTAPDGTIIVGGAYQNVRGSSDTAVMKLDPDDPTGDPLWLHTYDSGAGDYYVGDGVVDVAVDPEGNAVAVGFKAETSYSTWWVRKLSGEDGTELWTREHSDGTNCLSYANRADVDEQGNIYVCGTMCTNDMLLDFSLDIRIRKYAPDGTVIWEHEYDGSGHEMDYGLGIAVANGFVLATGIETRADARVVAWLTLLTVDGDEVWTRRHAGPGESGLMNQATTVAFDPHGNPVVVGQEINEHGDSDIWVRKYLP